MTISKGSAVSRIALVLFFISLFISPNTARAETWRGREFERTWRDAAWSFGPFRIQPAIVISNAGIDSNVYYTPSDPVRDFTLTAGPAATVYVPIHRKFVLSLFGSPQYVWYSKTERERTWNYYLNGSASLSLKRFFVSFEGRYSDARERWNTEIDVRPRRKEEGLGGSVLFQAALKTSFAVAYRTVRFNYENIEGEIFDVRERLNRDETYANFTAYYQASSQRKFFIDLEYGQFEFEFAEASALKDSRSYAIYGGLEFSPLGRRVRGRLRLGYKQFDILDSDGEDYKGMVGDTQVSVRVARPFVIRGSYIRDVNFSLWYNNAYYIESRPGAGVSFYLTSFLRLDYDYSLGRNSYPVPEEIAPGEEVKRLDEYRIHSVGIYFRIWKKAALGVVGSQWIRDSNLDLEDDKRYFLGLNLTYDF